MKRKFLVSHIYTRFVEAYSEDQASDIGKTYPPNFDWWANGDDDTWEFEEFVREQYSNDGFPILPEAKEGSE